MKGVSLLAAAAIVLIANSVTLLHAWRNRSGPVDADIVLTQRELVQSWNSVDDDSGVGLTLLWGDPQSTVAVAGRTSWLDSEKLAKLGFDTSVPPSAPAAGEFYQRQRSRRACVALEYNGSAWREWSDYLETQERTQPIFVFETRKQRESVSHLIAIDADTSGARLRERHPDRSSVIVVPAVIRIALVPSFGEPAATRLRGWIEGIPASVHVPLPFSNVFRKAGRKAGLTYSVHLRYGAALEPWVAGVEATTSAPLVPGAPQRSAPR